MINCGRGTITLFGRTIHEAHGGYGTIPMAMVLAKSSNIGAIQIGLRVGQANMHRVRAEIRFWTEDRRSAAGGIGRKSEKAGALEHGFASFHVDGARDQRHHAATGAGGGGGGQRRLAGAAAADFEEGQPDGAGGATGARAQAGDGHHHAADDGRRGDAGRHGDQGAGWKAIRAAGRPDRRRSTTRWPDTTRMRTTVRSWASRR